MTSPARPEPAFSPPTALYIHVPICSSKCSYCDFYSLPAAGIAEAGLSRLVDAVLGRAMALSERFSAAAFQTIYVGGGTPTALPIPLLGRLLDGLAPLRAPGCEWTVEANPESLGPPQIELFRRHGVTRLSLGVQSLDDAELRLLGRPHTAANAVASVALGAASDLIVSADLIAGIPSGAPTDRLARFATRLVECGVDHLSIYDLSLEEGTPLASAVEGGGLRLPGIDESFEAWEAARRALALKGFRRYEVSNFAPPGGECRHNLRYWDLESYIGAGPGAVSTLVGTVGSDCFPGYSGGAALRIEECRRIEGYEADAGACATETAIAPQDAAFETILMGFRTVFGLDLDRFADRFGCAAEELLAESLASWARRLRRGMAPPGTARKSRRLALDRRGLDLLNRFLRDCLGELQRRFTGSTARLLTGSRVS